MARPQQKQGCDTRTGVEKTKVMELREKSNTLEDQEVKIGEGGEIQGAPREKKVKAETKKITETKKVEVAQILTGEKS
ncbi:hypothetical protein Celaphus_00003413 [Cervus elaphus hippelaphus]|uniref:Uncharacterized protein n=1 Tax=Cervus elaphus hippelaphus TaxID=46360 RepID=A0A212D1J5_CEREH|nr:hypothetical protein Celaphus_00003413 [Cervus elaphus hippelaphus]